MLRANSTLHETLGKPKVNFLDHAVRAINRILPHLQVAPWRESSWAKPASVWASPNRTEIRVTLAIGPPGKTTSRSLIAEVKRRNLAALWRSGTRNSERFSTLSILTDLNNDVLQKSIALIGRSRLLERVATDGVE
jgi:hypothetical protein